VTYLIVCTYIYATAVFEMLFDKYAFCKLTSSSQSLSFALFYHKTAVYVKQVYMGHVLFDSSYGVFVTQLLS